MAMSKQMFWFRVVVRFCGNSPYLSPGTECWLGSGSGFVRHGLNCFGENIHQYAAALGSHGGLNQGDGLKNRCEEGTFSPEGKINASLK